MGGGGVVTDPSDTCKPMNFHPYPKPEMEHEFTSLKNQNKTENKESGEQAIRVTTQSRRG